MTYSYPSFIVKVYDLKSVGPLEIKLVAPMPEQIKTTTMHFYGVIEMHCCGPDLFWDGCTETQILDPQIVDYQMNTIAD